MNNHVLSFEDDISALNYKIETKLPINEFTESKESIFTYID
jgi:hypothetical protein